MSQDLSGHSQSDLPDKRMWFGLFPEQELLLGLGSWRQRKSPPPSQEGTRTHLWTPNLVDKVTTVRHHPYTGVDGHWGSQGAKLQDEMDRRGTSGHQSVESSLPLSPGAIGGEGWWRVSFTLPTSSPVCIPGNGEILSFLSEFVSFWRDLITQSGKLFLIWHMVSLYCIKNESGRSF